jgi:hypothetical protein
VSFAAAHWRLAPALTPLLRRASAKIEFLRQKKEQDAQRAAEAKAKQDAADHRAALVSVFAGLKAMNEIIDKVYDESWSYRQMGNFIDMCFMLRVAAEAAKTTGALIGNADAVSNVAACGRLLSATVTDVKAWERSGPRRRLMMSAPPPAPPPYPQFVPPCRVPISSAGFHGTKTGPTASSFAFTPSFRHIHSCFLRFSS